MCRSAQSFPELKAGPSPQLQDGSLEGTLLWYCLALEKCLCFLVEVAANCLLKKMSGLFFFSFFFLNHCAWSSHPQLAI